ncbi:TPA: hypothetical protein ACH3X1_012322 [Trebouxia sp. C0004]
MLPRLDPHTHNNAESVQSLPVKSLRSGQPQSFSPQGSLPSVLKKLQLPSMLEGEHVVLGDSVKAVHHSSKSSVPLLPIVNSSTSKMQNVSTATRQRQQDVVLRPGQTAAEQGSQTVARLVPHYAIPQDRTPLWSERDRPGRLTAPTNPYKQNLDLAPKVTPTTRFSSPVKYGTGPEMLSASSALESSWSHSPRQRASHGQQHLAPLSPSRVAPPAMLKQGELLAAVNDTLEALGLPRGTSPPPLSRGQRWLAAHGLSAGLPTDTASVSEAQQRNASSATSSAQHPASSVSGQTSGSMVSAVALPHKIAQEAVSNDSGQSAGAESGLQAQQRVPEGSAQEWLDAVFAAAKPDSIIGAASIEARSAAGIQLQMIQGSTSSDVQLENLLRGVQGAASGSPASSSAYGQDAMQASRAASGLAALHLDASAIQLVSMADAARFERLRLEPDLARTEPDPNSPECQMLSPAPRSFSPAPHSLSPASQSLSPAPQLLSPESQSLTSEPQLPSMEPYDQSFYAMPAAGTQSDRDAAARQIAVGTSIAQQQDGQTQAIDLHRPSIAQQDTVQVANPSPDSVSGAGSSSNSSRAGSIGSSESLLQERHLLAAQSGMAQVEATGVAPAALLVDSRVTGRTASSAFGTSKAVGSTSRDMEGMAQTPAVSTAELQLHPDRSTGLHNSIGSMTAVDLAQRQSEDADAQHITKASDAIEPDHASLVGGSFVGTADQDITVSVLQAEGDLSKSFPTDALQASPSSHDADQLGVGERVGGGVGSAAPVVDRASEGSTSVSTDANSLVRDKESTAWSDNIENINAGPLPASPLEAVSAFPGPLPASPLEASTTEDHTGGSSSSSSGHSSAVSASEQQEQALERSALSMQLGQHIVSQQSGSATEAEDAQQAAALEQGTPEAVSVPVSAALISSMYKDGNAARRGDAAAESPLHEQSQERLHQPQQQQQQHDVSHQTAVDISNAAAQCTDTAAITPATLYPQAVSSSSKYADSPFGMPLEDSQSATAAEHLINIAATESAEETSAQTAAEPLQKCNSGLWRDCNSPISSMASGHMSLADADDINPADFEDLDMSHSMQGSSSLQSSSSSLDATAVGWESMHQSQSHSPDLLVFHTQQQTSEHEVGKVTAVSEFVSQGEALLVQSSSLMLQSAELTIQGSSAAALMKSPAANALLQVSQPSAPLQQGMAAATAQLLLLGAQWGSNLGSLCNLGLMLSPSGFILLSPKYEIMEIIGEGAYGLVMKCRVVGTQATVAVKEFKIEDFDEDAEALRACSLREVQILKELHHPNVVTYLEDFMLGNKLFIVCEYIPHSLLQVLEGSAEPLAILTSLPSAGLLHQLPSAAGLVEEAGTAQAQRGPPQQSPGEEVTTALAQQGYSQSSPKGLPRRQVHHTMQQLMSALDYIHNRGIVYRDVKPENVLVDNQGTIKLCDFGFSRHMVQGDVLTDYVATRWYRAPELLLGAPYQQPGGQLTNLQYGCPVDIWAAGCLMAELTTGEPLFPGSSDIDQLHLQLQLLGPLPASMATSFCCNPHNMQLLPLPAKPVSSLRAW